MGRPLRLECPGAVYHVMSRGHERAAMFRDDEDREIREAVSLEWKVPVELLARRRGGEDKKAAVYLARRLTHLGGREVGAAFWVKPARVSHIVGSIESNPSSSIARRIAKLRKRIIST